MADAPKTFRIQKKILDRMKYIKEKRALKSDVDVVEYAIFEISEILKKENEK